MTEKKRGRPLSDNTMVSVHLRVPAVVLDFYKKFDNSSRAMREALREYMQQNS